MPNGFLRQTIRSTLPQEDMALKLCLRLIQIITQSIHPMRLLSELVTSIQSNNRNLSSETAILRENSPRKKQLSSTSMWRIRQIWTDQDRPFSIIARDMWWTQRCGIALAGQRKKILTLIRIERNTESSSISRSRSITGSSDRVRASCVTRTWPMSQETCVSLGLEEKNWIIRDSRKLEEEWRMDSPLISTM